MGERDFLNASDPFLLLKQWIEDAARTEPCYADAAQLATVDAEGMPNVRTVLIREYGADGLVFYTNCRSAKGRELLATRKGALLFYWKSLSRQIRLRGPVDPVDDETADAYFASRPRLSRIGAHASRQSEPMESRKALEMRVREFEALYADADVPRPSYWSGFRLTPVCIEFWQEGPFRMHDRLQFSRIGNTWSSQLLYP